MYLFIYSSSLKSSFSGASDDDDDDDVSVLCVCVSPSRASSLLRFFASSLSLSSVSKVDKKRYQQIFPTLIFLRETKKKHVILTPHRVDVLVVVLQVLDFVVVSLVVVDDAMQIRRIGDR